MLPLKGASLFSCHLPYGISSYRAIQNSKNVNINKILKRTITSNGKVDFQVKKLSLKNEVYNLVADGETRRSILFVGAFLFVCIVTYIDNKKEKERTGGGVVIDFG